MSLEDVPRCQHVKVNGTQCGSPALRRRRRCYFHEGVRAERVKLKTDPYAKYEFEMPLLEDANGVQVALMRVLQMFARGQMDAKKAGLMLYGLQTASANLKNTKFEAEKVTDVVIDCNSVDQTCINGPQWFARDFANETEEVEEVEVSGVAAAGEAAGASGAGVLPLEHREQASPVQASEEPVMRAQVGGEKVRPDEARRDRDKDRRDKARPDKARVDKRKRPGVGGIEDEPPSLAKILLQRMGLEPLAGSAAASRSQ